MKIILPMTRAQAAVPLQWICDRTNIFILSPLETFPTLQDNLTVGFLR